VFYKKCFILLFFLIVAFSFDIAFAQNESKPVDSISQTQLKHVDTIRYVDKPDDSTNYTQNPTVALFKSLIFPGGGQFDNKSYIKGTIVFTLEVALIGAVVHYTDKATTARRNFENAKAARGGLVSAESTTIPYGSISVNDAHYAELFNDYQDARDEKNLFRWYLGTFIFLSMFDAFVDAHLAQFPKIDDKISFDVESGSDNMLKVKLSYYLW